MYVYRICLNQNVVGWHEFEKVIFLFIIKALVNGGSCSASWVELGSSVSLLQHAYDCCGIYIILVGLL